MDSAQITYSDILCLWFIQTGVEQHLSWVIKNISLYTELQVQNYTCARLLWCRITLSVIIKITLSRNQHESLCLLIRIICCVLNTIRWQLQLLSRDRDSYRYLPRDRDSYHYLPRDRDSYYYIPRDKDSYTYLLRDRDSLICFFFRPNHNFHGQLLVLLVLRYLVLFCFDVDVNDDMHMGVQVLKVGGIVMTSGFLEKMNVIYSE